MRSLKTVDKQYFGLFLFFKDTIRLGNCFSDFNSYFESSESVGMLSILFHTVTDRWMVMGWG